MSVQKLKRLIPYVFVLFSTIVISSKLSLGLSQEPNYAILEDTRNKEEINTEVDFEEVEDTTILNDDIDYSKYIEIEGHVEESTVNYLNEKLNLIPQRILDKYFGDEGKILITDKNISDTYYSDYDFGHVIGIHDAKKNIIYISNSEYAIDNALIHEFGHVLDSISGWKSMENYFKEIFEKEKESFEVYSVDNHYKKNEREFFAEVFQQYILDPDSCKESAPMSYSFVEVMIKSI